GESVELLTPRREFERSDRHAGIPPELTRQLDWVLAFPNGKRRADRWSGYLRRFTDWLLIVLAMPIWLPVLAICCLLVKIESPSDPVIFRASRTGRDGRRFPMYKIRTMVRD